MACILHIDIAGDPAEAGALLARTEESFRRFGGAQLLASGASRVARFDQHARAAQCALTLRARAAEHNRRAEPSKRVSCRIAAHAVRDKGLSQATRVGPSDLELCLRVLEVVPPGRIFATREAFLEWQGLKDCACLPLGSEYFRGQPEAVDLFEIFPNPTLESV